MRLDAGSISSLPPEVRRPGYDRSEVRRGVVHLGLGAFHRAHQAVVFDAVLAAGDPRWGICGVSFRSTAVRNALGPQDCLYTVEERDGERSSTSAVGAVLQVLVATEDASAVIDAMSDPAVGLVTLTVTEKGYKLDIATGKLQVGDVDLFHDIVDLTEPRTAVGFIVAALARRKRAGVPPFTTMSCDNLPSNGRLLGTAVIELARHHDPALAEWIEREAAFPSSMVDRIVPAVTGEVLEETERALGLRDEAAIRTEPFLQWVIEDNFCGPRPDLDRHGAVFTADVAPWEAAKIRLLNGAHSAIAYLGGLAGFEFVHQFIADPNGAWFVRRLWSETAGTLELPRDLDLDAYCSQLMLRFANPSMRHRTRQIAQDGSQKLPQRLVAPLLECRAAGEPVDALALAIASWMRWQDCVDDNGDAFAVEDPLAKQLRCEDALSTAPADRVAVLLEIGTIFPPAMRQDASLCERLAYWLGELRRSGALGAVAASRAAEANTCDC